MTGWTRRRRPTAQACPWRPSSCTPSRLDYYQHNSNALAQLYWSSPSTPQTIIPQTQLYPYTNPPPTVLLTGPASNATYTATASVTHQCGGGRALQSPQRGELLRQQQLSGHGEQRALHPDGHGAGPGSYALTAVATDGSGLSSTSAPVNITVGTGSGQPYGLTSNGAAPAFFNMPTTFTGTLPTLLSQTGVFSNTPSMTPAAGLIPYVPNTPVVVGWRR